MAKCLVTLLSARSLQFCSTSFDWKDILNTPAKEELGWRQSEPLDWRFSMLDKSSGHLVPFWDQSDLVLEINILSAVFTADSALRSEQGLSCARSPTWLEIPECHGL